MSFLVGFEALDRCLRGVLGLALTKLLIIYFIIFVVPQRIHYFLAERIRLSL